MSVRLMINKFLKWLGTPYFIGKIWVVERQPFVFDFEPDDEGDEAP